MTRPVTEHYGIAKYGPRGSGDPMAAYSVYNPAMVTIDDILFQHKGLIDALEARCHDLENRMTNAESRIISLENRMTQAETEIGNLRQSVNQINQTITQMGNKYDATIRDILDKIYGGGTVGDDGHISWGDSGKIAVGNMSIYGNGSLTSYIKTRGTVGNDDVRVN